MNKKDTLPFSVIENNKVKYKHTDLIDLNPKGKRQNSFINAYFNKKNPLIFLTGYAGTGKTFLALHAALTQVLDPSTHYDKIFIVRSAVESGQSQGFLPGDLSEKNAPYEAAYVGLLREDIFKDPNPLHYQRLVELGILSFGTVNYLRGTTIKNAVIIIEESQNMDYEELYTVITRIGNGSRILVTGDIKQDDLKRKRKKSGLPHLLKVLNNMPHEYHSVIEFEKEDIQRSELCKQFIISDYETEED